MKRLSYRVAADSIWIAHLAVVLVALFGWMVTSLWDVYMLVLAGTLLSDLVFSYCILSKWEYELRKKLDPTIDYEFNYASYYTYRLSQGRVSSKFLGRAATIFVTLSLAINLYFHTV